MADQPPEEKKPIKDKIEEQISSLHAEEKLDQLYSFTKTHTRDAIAYVILIAGIIISLFNGVWGGTLIGIIAGIYFSSEIVYSLKNFRFFIDKEGVFKTFILGGVFFGLFLARPMLFIGIAAALGIKTLLLGEEKNPTSTKEEKTKEE